MDRTATLQVVDLISVPAVHCQYPTYPLTRHTKINMQWRLTRVHARARARAASGANPLTR